MATTPRPPSFLQAGNAGNVREASFGKPSGASGSPPLGFAERIRPEDLQQEQRARAEAASVAAMGHLSPGSNLGGLPAHEVPPEAPVMPEPTQPPMEVPEVDLEAIEAEINHMRENLAQVVDDFRTLGADLRAQASADAVKLGFEVARALIRRELEITAEPLVDVIKEALGEVAEARQVRVRMHPEDILALEAFGLEEKEPGIAKTELVNDPALGRGDIIIESDLGSVNASLESRLEAIRKALRGAMGA